MDLEIKVVEEKNKSIVQLMGEIDVYTAPKLKETLIPLTQLKDHHIEVCFDQVNYMDSTGLGVFVHALKSTKKNGSHMKLIHLQDRVLRLFSITGLEDVIDINSTIRGGTD